MVVYANDAETTLAGVEPRLIERTRSGLRAGRCVRSRKACASGWTWTSGWASPVWPDPDGGTEQKPTGLVWLSVAGPQGWITRSVNLPGGRADVRDRATTVALHMVRRLLLGERDG